MLFLHICQHYLDFGGIALHLFGIYQQATLIGYLRFPSV